MWGAIVCSVVGNHVSFSVAWQNGSAGIYDGWIDQWGFVSGTTWGRWNPNSVPRGASASALAALGLT
jgi:hypothetical protein